MIQSDPLRMMFERQYFEPSHNVLAIYPTFRMARYEFRIACDDAPAQITCKFADMTLVFPQGNTLRFMVIENKWDTDRILGYQLVDYFMHNSMWHKPFYDRLLAILACRVRSK